MENSSVLKFSECITTQVSVQKDKNSYSTRQHFDTSLITTQTVTFNSEMEAVSH